MDSIDKRLLLALDEDCRLSYQTLAERVGLTATAVKKRMNRLVETGVIEGFSVVLRPAMLNSDYLIALVSTDGSENEEEFIELMGANLYVSQVAQVVTGVGRLYFLHCEYVGAEGLQNISGFIRNLDSVTNIELHPRLTQRGEPFEIKNMHLRVLKLLLKDARMQVGRISEESGLTTRRVSRAIREMQDSSAFWFVVRWNLSFGNNAQFYLKITYEEQEFKMDEIDEWLHTTFPDDYWFSFYSAMEPVIFAKFVTDHYRDADQISLATKDAPFSKSVDILLTYPVKKFPRLSSIKIEEMIRDAGL
ncbi:MAG: winged helix-turn-helix transcriptional regulator [Candidatus Thorarchaeota archaeon]